MSSMSPERAAAIRFKRGLEARERDRPRYDKMPEHKLMAARVFHQLYLLTIRKRKRAIDVFRDFDLDDSGTIDREEFAAGCKALGMNLGKVAERDASPSHVPRTHVVRGIRASASRLAITTGPTSASYRFIRCGCRRVSQYRSQLPSPFSAVRRRDHARD